jgi:hypothetical protein
MNGLPYSVDTPYNCLYSLVMAVWSTVLIEVWKRRQNEIAHLWNMTDKIKRQDFKMPEFRSDPVIKSKDNEINYVNTASSHMRRVYTEIPTVLLSIGCVVACFIGTTIYQRDNKGSTPREVGASIINALIIIILGFLYKKIAIKMANWENHKFLHDWEESLASKNFAFAFVNSNIALFSVAFYE